MPIKTEGQTKICHHNCSDMVGLCFIYLSSCKYRTWHHNLLQAWCTFHWPARKLSEQITFHFFTPFTCDTLGFISNSYHPMNFLCCFSLASVRAGRNSVRQLHCCHSCELSVHSDTDRSYSMCESTSSWQSWWGNKRKSPEERAEWSERSSDTETSGVWLEHDGATAFICHVSLEKMRQFCLCIV